jgi:hypothetical protein
MDSDNIRGRRGLRRIGVSVVLTALILTALIFLLALTVRYGREKERVTQFGQQQVSVARGIAARLADLVASVEPGLETIASKPFGSAQAVHSLQSFPEGRQGRVLFTALTDTVGNVIGRVPGDRSGLPGGIGRTELFRQVRSTGRPAVGVIPDSGGGESRVVAIAVPRQQAGGRFVGVLFAVLNLAAFDDDRGDGCSIPRRR